MTHIMLIAVALATEERDPPRWAPLTSGDAWTPRAVRDLGLHSELALVGMSGMGVVDLDALTFQPVDGMFGFGGGDIDTDGIADFVVAVFGEAGDYTYVDLDSGASVAYVTPEGRTWCAGGFEEGVVDVDLDGRVDRPFNDGSAWLTTERGFDGGVVGVPAAGEAACAAHAQLVGDLDDDGRPDLVRQLGWGLDAWTDEHGWASAPDFPGIDYELHLTSEWTRDVWPVHTQWQPGPGYDGCGFAAVDVDGDGPVELAAVCYFNRLHEDRTHGTVFVVEDPTGDPTVRESADIRRSVDDPEHVVPWVRSLGDGDGDGDGDIIARLAGAFPDDEAQATAALWVLDLTPGDLLAGRSPLPFPEEVGTLEPRMHGDPLVADIDRDGVPDVMATMTSEEPGEVRYGLAVWASGRAALPAPAGPSDPPPGDVRADEATSGGCGCESGGSGWASLAVFALLAVRRRG